MTEEEKAELENHNKLALEYLERASEKISYESEYGGRVVNLGNEAYVQASYFGDGRVGLGTTGVDEHGFSGLIMTTMEEPMEIGASKIVKRPDFCSKHIDYMLMFDSIDSVDVVINSLKEIKENLSNE